MIWMEARYAWPVRILPVRAENRVIINNSVSSSANGEECEKSEIKEINGEGDISITSELNCEVGSQEKEEVLVVPTIKPEVKMEKVKFEKKLIKFDRESYRKDVLGMGPARQNFMIKKFGLLEFMK